MGRINNGVSQIHSFAFGTLARLWCSAWFCVFCVSQSKVTVYVTYWNLLVSFVYTGFDILACCYRQKRSSSQLFYKLKISLNV